MSIEKINLNPENEESESWDKMDERLGSGNAEIEEKEREKSDQERQKDLDFIREYSRITELMAKYEDDLGTPFSNQKVEIIRSLRVFMEQNSELDRVNLEESLEKKLKEEIKERGLL